MANKENTLTWLHLSDIHFRCDSEWQGKNVREKLLSFLTQQFADNQSLKPDMIFCTGDIAFGEMKGSSLEQQYQHAKEFFDQVLRLCELPKERLLVVPGNHDVNREDIQPSQQGILIKWANESRQQEQSVNSLIDGKNIIFKTAMLRLEAYQEFVTDYLPHQRDKNGRCIYQQQLDINGVKLGIFGFNSAWSSAGKEDDRNLWLGASWQFNQAERELQNADVKLGLIHHPYDWFNEAEREIYPRRAETGFDFILHGHTHDMRINNANGLITVGAGATGASHDEEFGINITCIDLLQASGESHLYTFNLKHHDWQIYPVPNYAPKGIWTLDLKSSLRLTSIGSAQSELDSVKTIEGEVTQLQDEQQETKIQECEAFHPVKNNSQSKSGLLIINRHRIYGRDKLINSTISTLPHKRSLLIYGMRGNGKSAFIEALLNQKPLEGIQLKRKTMFGNTKAESIYQLMASQLGDSSEAGKLPSNDLIDIKHHLERLKSQAKEEVVIWLENAHLLLIDDKYKDEGVKNLIAAIRIVHPRWYWLFELREKPCVGTVTNSEIIEITGLTRDDLKQLLSDAGPQQNNSIGLATWYYNAKEIKTIYGWLGGGHGNHAHPQATQLLVTVAQELMQTPLDTLKTHMANVEEKLEVLLLRDLYHQVLNDAERGLFATMALYRDYIPVDHVEAIEQWFDWSNALKGLNLRCLLTNNGEYEYCLHGFFKVWLRGIQGYSLSDDSYNQVTSDIDINELDDELIARQQLISQLWRDDVKGRKLVNSLNIKRTNEALFHAIHAGEYLETEEITAEMLGTGVDEIYERLYVLYQDLFKTKGDIIRQRDLLILLVKLRPKEPMLYRFLASAWKSLNGWEHDEVRINYRQASRILPERPEYWANYGRACLSQKDSKHIKQFLSELEKYESDCLVNGIESGIDDLVRAVEANCKTFLGDELTAFDNREKLIGNNTKHHAIYVDHVKALMSKKHFKKALEVIAKAKQNKAYNLHTISIEANVYQAMGEYDKAIELLEKTISSGFRQDSVLYNSLAKLYLREGKIELASNLIKQAKLNGVVDEYINITESKINQALKRESVLQVT